MSSPKSDEHPKQGKNDLILRGSHRPTPLGRSLFVGLRSLDIPLQYYLLHSGPTLLSRLNLPSIVSAAPAVALGLNPHQLLLFSMAVGAATKQNYWLIFVSQEEMPPLAATFVGVFNTVFNSLNSILFTYALTSSAAPSVPSVPIPFTEGIKLPLPAAVGAVLYGTGLFLEWASEIQRNRFKNDPKNKGKCYSGGLFGLARHINYGGYTLWRSGYAMAAARWTWGLVVAGWFSYDFLARAIPVLDEYCQDRYGEQWARFKRSTPYKLLPWIV